MVGSALAVLLVEDIAIAHGGRVEIHSDSRSQDDFTSRRFMIAVR